MAHILIAEDERSINGLIRKNLELVGHSCQCVFDGQAAVDAAQTNTFDLLILDVMMPRLDGFEVIQCLDAAVPVIFLTARGQTADRIKGLRLGADDYMVKPFDMLELSARVDSVLRRTKKALESFELDDVVVNLTSNEVLRGGVPLDFTPQEFLLVCALIKNRNIALSRDKLLQIAWGYDFMGDTRTVDVHIHAIRKKLGWEARIKTVYKLGYRLEVR